jgi:metallo-beta-lactamase class B
LQRWSGAAVAASPWSAAVMAKTGVGRDDPQYGTIPPIAKVARVELLRDGQTFHVGKLAITAHLTPGHTPGGTSWTWQSCEAGRCLGIVYADSLTPVSAAGFKFTSSRDYPGAMRDFEKSFAFLRAAACDILLTTHPDASAFWDRVAERQPMVDPDACRQLAGRAEEQLRRRIAVETGR